MKKMLSTKEVAAFLGVNEKMVYTLVAEKNLPASKITGKWLFPQHLVEQWVEANTLNMPTPDSDATHDNGVLVIAGSNDPLLEKTIGLYNSQNGERLAVFGNLGSMIGIRMLKQGKCHIATSHLLQTDGDDYNFEYLSTKATPPPVVVNFCRRRQGLLLAHDNPHNIRQTEDLVRKELRIVNRKLGTGTRLLFDRALKAANIKSEQINGYDCEVERHIDVGLAVVAGTADAGPGIQPVAEQLGLAFVPWRWERYDLLIDRNRFFNPATQDFLSLLHDQVFMDLAGAYNGYDLSSSGKMIFPPDNRKR
jgi:excisionase family DNA binding protein